MIVEKIIDIPIFRIPVKIVIYNDKEEVSKKYQAFSSTIVGCCIYDEEYRNITIVVPYDNETTFLHELEHAKNQILLSINYQPQYGNDEIDAYLFEYLYTKFHPILEEAINKMNKK